MKNIKGELKVSKNKNKNKNKSKKNNDKNRNIQLLNNVSVTTYTEEVFYASYPGTGEEEKTRSGIRKKTPDNHTTSLTRAGMSSRWKTSPFLILDFVSPDLLAVSEWIRLLV